MRISKLVRIFILLLAFILLQTSCSDDTVQKREAPLKISEDFINYVSAYTSGIVTKNAEIKFVLNKPVEYPYEVGKELPSDIFSISPSVKGVLQLKDAYTVVFKPSNLLESNKTYRGELDLGKLLKAKGELSKFPFQIQTLKQNARLDFEQYKSYTNDNLTKNYIEATIRSADFIADKNLPKLVEAEQGSKKLPVKFTRKSNTEVLVTVDSILRGEMQSFVLLDFDGGEIDVDHSDNYKVNVLKLNDFKVVESSQVFYPKTSIKVVFSSPIGDEQDLKGFISLTNKKERKRNFDYTIDNTVLNIYPSGSDNFYNLKIHKGIVDVKGNKTYIGVEYGFDFERVLPSIDLMSKGNIMPNSVGLILPFKAKGLKDVHVTIVKVFGNNMGQFLQENSMSNDSYLRKVGRPIFSSDVPLNIEDKSDYKKEKQFYLDLNKLIGVEKGAIYNIELSFKKNNLAYVCGESNEKSLTSIEENESYWDGDSYSRHNDDYDYDYDERNNPCHSYYYRYHSTRVSKNLISSNLGIIVKHGDDGNYNVIVTDLKSALPVEDALVEYYNYQNQVISSSSTNSDGFASFLTRKKTFYIKVTKGEDVGYMRLESENALSYSMFDISGKRYQKGVKGFIYGERGVWRPGDSLHLFFVMGNKSRSLSNNYPVTFTLYNPDNQLVEKRVVKEGINGFYKYGTVTSSDAKTGNWRVIADVGVTSFSKTINIETVKPNRLKVELTSKSKILKTGYYNKFTLASKWLTGANCGALKATVKVKLNPIKTTFSGYKQYNFDDPTKRFSSREKNILDGKLDSKGNKTFNYKPKKSSDAPGMLRARFTSYVYEKGGDYSLNTQDFLLSNYKSYVGMNLNLDEKYNDMIFTGKDHTINLVTLDRNGKKVNRNLSVKIYKLRWSWWWSSNDESIASYIKNTDHIIKSSGTVKTVNGKGSYKFNFSNSEWGRYFIQITDKTSGHTVGKEVYIDWPNWNSRNNSSPDAATMLTFSSDKPKYKVGEEAKLIIPTSGFGRALISIEKGGKVLKMFWADTKKGVTEVKFKVTSDMAPNVFANITYIQKHSQTINDLPIRMYGVAPILVEDPDTHLEPVIKAPESIESEADYSITVSEKNSKAMVYSLAIVDEGLLDITNFKTPTLWSYFYQREALRTTTWDMYDYVIGAFGSKLESMLAIGGDSEAEKKKERKANRFVPVVKVLGPFSLDAGSKKVHKLKMSNYIGSVKVMVVAAKDGAYGKADKAVPVKKPVMVLATLPRVLGTNEVSVLPITVFAMDKNVKTVNVKVEINDKLTFVGESTAKLNFRKSGEKMVYLKLKTSGKTGIAKVKVMVEGNGSKAYQEIELDVRNPNPVVSDSKEYLIEGEEEFEIEPLGIEGTNDMKIEVSSMPSLNLDERLSYLIKYPHGCIEQTTSSVFPQLFLDKITNVDRKTRKEIESNIKAGINRLYKFQLSDGGMGYWIGNRYSNQWGTSYAGHFMFEAEKLGYSLPTSFKKNWVRYQKAKAESWTSNTPTDMLQAYRLYALALSGNPLLGAMNRMKEQSLNSAAREMLASTYALIGQLEVAKQLLMQEEEDRSYSRDYYYYSYGSASRDMAVRLLTFSEIKDQERALRTLKTVAKNLSSTRYMSTQTASFSLMSVAKYITTFNPAMDIDIDYEVNGDNNEADTKVPVYTIYIKDADKLQKVKLENNNKGKLYVRVIRHGIPLKRQEQEYAENLSLKVRYTDTDGNLINVTKLQQGTEFKAWVTIKNTNNIEKIKDVALSQIFPSGWEIVNNRLLGTVDKSADQPDFLDIRDDRVYQYFDLNKSESKTFVVSLITAYSGEYYLPGINAEAMYDDTFKAMTKGKDVTVIRGK